MTESSGEETTRSAREIAAHPDRPAWRAALSALLYSSEGDLENARLSYYEAALRIEAQQNDG
jgi:hypothetical protein